MSDLFNFTKKRNRFAVVGNPIAHSLSPLIHKSFANQFGIALEYEAVQVEVGGFVAAVDFFFAHGGAGLNITVPFKREAFKFCKDSKYELSARADAAAAVNTIKFIGEQELSADNTDGIGLQRDLENNLNWHIKDARVLILGAGGAARGIISPLLDANPKNIFIANRTASTAQKLAEEFNSHAAIHACGLDQLNANYDDAGGEEFAKVEFAKTEFDLVINATAASLQNELPEVAKGCIKGARVYDLAYKKNSPTLFMQWAQTLGARATADGLGMLVEQAAESFYVWHNKRADTAAALNALRKNY